MSPIAIASTVFKLISAVSSGSSSSSSSASSRVGAQSAGDDFAASLASSLSASQNASSASSISVLGKFSGSSGLPFGGSHPLFPTNLSDAFSLAGLNTKRGGLDATGRNAALFDPESAYRMMTDINNREVGFKAQFAEMTDMKSELGEMHDAGLALGKAGASGSDEAIRSHLQAFVDKYNEWVKRFDDKVQNGGVLAGAQAADVSLYELRQSIENRFNGAAHGLHGLRDIGISIDPTTHLASLDSNKLDSMLAHVKEGVVSAVNEFSASFARSAEMLASAGNFVPNRLANLDRAIDFLRDNGSSLRAEFGTGDAARPNAQVARALAAYNAMFKNA